MPQAGDRQVTTLKGLLYFVNAVSEEMDKPLNGEKGTHIGALPFPLPPGTLRVA